MATTINSQLHGYEHGHHLINSSAKVSKTDQAVIDRISDVAGPLRPGETFSPYLTGYPLPSGDSYVLARTWQDFSVPRAGCVRTLSLIVPIDVWAASASLHDYLRILDPGVMPTAAVTTTLREKSENEPLPPASSFAANELIEATFLEEAKPIVMLDTPDPELIAIRLLTALWPGMRERFAVSTFALSPRKIEGRSFDLVFAPKDARSRFANWDGRRIDGRTSASTRHRWTQAIADRVFVEPHPTLLSEEDIRLIGARDSSGSAALRIALLWEELKGNLQRSPSAALGLLDIANSRPQADPGIVAALQPAIGRAAHKAAESFPAEEAWEFIGALAKKTFDSAFANTLPSIAAAAGDLAAKSPTPAVAFIEQSSLHDAILAMLPQIASGLEKDFRSETENALSRTETSVLWRLLESSPKLMQAVVNSVPLIARIGETLPQLPADALQEMKGALLPLLVDDRQLPAFAPLSKSLTTDELLKEVSHLADINDLAAETFIPLLATRARELKATPVLRNALATRKMSSGRDALIAAILTPATEDIDWLLRQKSVSSAFRSKQLLTLLQKASSDTVASIFCDDELARLALDILPDDATDVLLRATLEVTLPLSTHLTVVSRVLPLLPDKRRVELLWRTLERCLSEHFAGDEASTIIFFLNTLGDQADGKRLAQLGLRRELDPDLVSRNLIALDSASDEARRRALQAIDDIASILAQHYLLNLDLFASSACARLFSDAKAIDRRAHLSASAQILPALLRSGHSPVSAIVTATFPVVYRELAKEDEVPDLLRFIPFFDWDRCKSARRELVDTFLRSRVWSPADFALAGLYSDDLPRFLRRMAKADDGGRYIACIERDLHSLPNQAQTAVSQAISNLYLDWPAKYDWRD
ncbi:hypothetical protein [Agrobacterium tumefaciens]|uniref:GAP1-N1 domain-containing protein n=1 Tax=Agrobacterium tumefaciens TaxID=358 RepID=UPI0015746333|nr:hypothetical protein [Agrobacterium tumefaciens]NSX94029.1 hypothetical protein [Agrobacterium tumefaciens]